VNDRQRRDLEKHGTTQPPKPDFVLRADEVPSAEDLSRWVNEKLWIGPEGERDAIVATIRDMLVRHGSVRIFSEVRLVDPPPDLSSRGITLHWGKFFTINPPEDSA